MWVKICGCRDAAGVEAAVAAGADALGFIFAPSRRRVTVREAESLLRRVPPGVRRVGVLRSPRLGDVRALLAELPLDMLQVSGTLPRGMPDLPLLRTVYLGAEDRLPHGRLPRSDLLHVDRRVGDLAGGSGLTVHFGAAWRLAQGRRLVLSGGLAPENVALAIRAVGPYGVDVASGVETDGEPDPRRIAEFVRVAKEGAR